MTMTDIREKLYDYIRIADDKKVKAIYMILEDEIAEELKWWEDEAFIHELEQGYNAWENGKEKGYSQAELNASIQQLKKKRFLK